MTSRNNSGYDGELPALHELLLDTHAHGLIHVPNAAICYC